MHHFSPRDRGGADRRSGRIRCATVVAAASIALVACGGGDGSSSSSDAAEPAAEQRPAVPDQIEVLPESEIPTNLLPSVVVDDLQQNNKVNLRNIIPSDRPVVLWMWAPH